MKNKYREVVVKEISREVGNNIMCISYYEPDIYEESCTELSDNVFGIKRAKVEAKIVHLRVRNASRYKNKPFTTKVPIFSGRKAVIYALINPIDKKVFYIGTTTLPLKTRLGQHLVDSVNDSKTKVIADILGNSQRPTIVPLCTCPAEIQLIGHANLHNTSMFFDLLCSHRKNGKPQNGRGILSFSGFLSPML